MQFYFYVAQSNRSIIKQCYALITKMPWYKITFQPDNYFSIFNLSTKTRDGYVITSLFNYKYL